MFFKEGLTNGCLFSVVITLTNNLRNKVKKINPLLKTLPEIEMKKAGVVLVLTAP